MNARDFLNNNSALVTIIAVVILVVSLGVIIMNTRGPGAVQTVDLYFYDLNTGQLFVAASDQIPPIDVPGGQPIQTAQGPKPAGVRAHVFACGTCPDVTGMNADQVKAAGAQIAYIEMFTEQGKAAMTAPPNAQGPGPMMVDPMEQTLVAKAEDRKWLPMYSEQGYRLTEGAIQPCPDGSPPLACRP